MICPRCQNQLPDGSVACNKCGLMFNYQPQQQYYSQPAQPSEPQKKKSSKGLVLAIIGISLGVVTLAIIVGLIISNIPKEINYGDAESFEQALNDGRNLNGAVVKVKVNEYKHTLLGDNIWAGEHLNFYGNIKDAQKGDTIIVQVKSIKELEGSWLIRYKKVNGKETENTIKSD